MAERPETPEQVKEARKADLMKERIRQARLQIAGFRNRRKAGRLGRTRARRSRTHGPHRRK